MRADPFTFQADDGAEVFVHRWLPDDGKPRRGVLHIVHGMAEHGGRYARFAEVLTEAGWVVYAGDVRGHGRTARTNDDVGSFAREGGFQRVVRDQEQLLRHERAENPGLPLVIFGHSMGSFIAQRALMERSVDVKAAVLSGSSGKPTPLAAVARTVAQIERKRLGPSAPSPLLKQMVFGTFNAAFRPNRTPFDWLTTDTAVVDGYAADERCGFTPSAGMWLDVMNGTAEISRPDMQSRLPPELPVYLFAGSEDPLSDRAKGVLQLARALRTAGVRHVELRIYPGGRHEMLNEANHADVMRDIVHWLDAKVPAPQAATAS
ncbi:alpha/beta hydrolase [Chondromyces apiculatus]|uniref:Lysophospholipase n=1 Tax=Chondromyces apiculatus DSM 436 TaxID=1192034 RepID=A0A017T1A3_9BACT|nr:alpha/beta hydrolase [Chondromyces apiculatus]EYF02998.1 Lysophospholipase [Chondromyces apiculatus DSM 436]